jgi:hypothetical protein
MRLQVRQTSKVVTETVSELAADLRAVKQTVAKIPLVRADPELAAYANSVLSAIEQSGAQIGVKATLGKGLKKPVPAKEWVVGARREAALLTRVSKSKKDVLAKLATNVFGSPWLMEFGGGERVPMLDWLKKNHPPTRALFE